MEIIKGKGETKDVLTRETDLDHANVGKEKLPTGQMYLKNR